MYDTMQHDREIFEVRFLRIASFAYYFLVFLFLHFLVVGSVR